MKTSTKLLRSSNGTNAGWTPEAWVSATPTERLDVTKAPGIDVQVTSYSYDGTNPNLKTANSAIRYKIIFGENTNLKSYWLSTRSAWANEHSVGFSVRIVEHNFVNNAQFFSSFGYESGNSVLGICPVIYLDANVSLTAVETTNNVTTWNID